MFRLPTGRCVAAAIAVLALFQGNLEAQVPGNASAIGPVKKLTVEPASFTLAGPRDLRQLVVTGHYADGQVRDLTGHCEFEAKDPRFIVSPQGMVLPRQNGVAALTIKAGGQSMRVEITVRDYDKPEPVSFRHDVIAAFNVGGCNSGACHGTPNGKNGFKLSLRGYDPTADHKQLTRDVLGRRTDRQSPDNSLILLKGLGKIAHEGGIRFEENSLPGQTIRGWLLEGMQDDRMPPADVTKLEILPGARVLHSRADSSLPPAQQLAVLAHFADGKTRDVTPLTVFSSSDANVADVNAAGRVEFAKPGEIAILCRYLSTMATVNLAYLETKKGFAWSSPLENNYVDKHVFAKLKLLSIRPSELCSDEEFVRRVHLDVAAVLPTPAEVKSFLDDTDKAKRAKLIDRLLDRPECVDFWTMKWMDLLRNHRRTVGIKGAQAYQKWMHNHISKNTPFDQVVRELLTSSGNTFEQGQANYYRATKTPEELAETTAQLFLGIRMQCSKCHNHPFEKWTQDDYYSTAAFFARVKTTGTKMDAGAVVSLEKKTEVKHLQTGKVMPPRFLGGKPAPMEAEQDRREVFAAWLTAKENPFFARSIVNRLWFHLMGRGIVDPPDDFRDSNPPANEALLDALAKDFVDKDYNAKHVLRTILNSRTYQLSARANEFNKDDAKYFSHVVPKLLTAEQLLDAICEVTEESEKFTGAPAGVRATQLPDGDEKHAFLNAFGQPGRQLACECEREGDANLGQALQFINGSLVNTKITSKKNRISRLLSKKAPDAEILKELFLATLSRPPAESESKELLDFVAKTEDKRRAWEDVQWTLFNMKEFVLRH